MPRRPLPGDLPPERRIELANRLNSAAIHLLRRISQGEARELTGARLSALSVVVYGGPQNVTALARREGVAAPTMTRIVDALVRDSLVERERERGDRRSVRLSATPAGRRLLEEGRARRIRRLAEELSGLQEADLTALERACEVLEGLEPGREE